MIIDKETHHSILVSSLDKLERGYIVITLLMFLCGFAIGGAFTSHMLYDNVQSHYATAMVIKDKR